MGTQRTVYVAELFKKLEEQHLFYEAMHYQCFIVPGTKLGVILLELGETREISLRTVLYGSGQKYDLDGVDEFYYHVLLWDKEKQLIVGGYRFRTNANWDLQTIEQQSYMEKCYPGIYMELSNKKKFIEFGRAFLSVPYQKNTSAMYLIWSCALTYLTRQYAEHAVILGIPWIPLEDFKEESIAFMIRALSNKHLYHPSIRSRPRCPYEHKHRLTPELEQLAEEQSNVSAIFNVIGEIENRVCKPPSLLKQYIDTMEGKIHSLSFSPDFNLLEVLISTDLTDLPTDKLSYFVKGLDEVV